MVAVRATPFVGRADELGELRRSVERALGGAGPCAVFVFGPPGAGKTRLLREARRTIPHGHALFVTGYGVEVDVPLAAAAGLLHELPPDALGGDRLQAFEAADRWLARRGPSVVVVDDLQWVDGGSRALLHYLIRGALTRRDRLGLVIAAREDPGCRTFAAEVRTVLGRIGYVELELGPLSVAETAVLATNLADGRAGDPAEVHRLSGGWPFWVELCSRRPDQRDHTLQRWLAEADPDAWTTLGVLAVAGRPLSADALAAILRWPRLRVLSAIEAVRGRGWTAPASGGERIVHDLLRDAVLEQHPPAELARLHGMVARHLERVAGEDVHTLLEAIVHRSHAGSTSVALVRRVLDSPGRRLLDTEEIGRLWTVVSSARSDDPDVGTVLRQLATLTAEVGEPDAALERWVAAAARLPSGRDRATAWLEAARAAAVLEDPGTAQALLARARTVPSPDEALCVQWDAQEASIDFLRGDLVAGTAAASRALRRARALDGARDAGHDSDLIIEAQVRALAAAGEAARLRGDPAAMVEVGTEMTAVAAGRDDSASLQGLRDAGFGLLMLGRPVEAETHLRAAYDHANAAGRPLAMLDAGFWLVLLLHTRGRLQAARAVVDECLSLADRVGRGSRSVENVHVADHLVGLSDGDWHVAVDGLRTHADAEADAHARIRVTYWLLSALGRLAPDTSAGEVLARTERAEADARAAACRRCAGELLLRAADALARCGRPGQAVARMERHRADRTSDDAYLAWWQDRAQASIALATGAPDRARLLAAAGRRATGHGFALEALWTGLDLALTSADDRDAVARLEQTRQDASARGATTEARLAEQALRVRGVRAWRRGAAPSPDGDGTALTAREQEVADLVSAGATNREVAERLFLSPKTVESHLSHIFTKLDVRNRVELAALVHGERPGR